MNDVTYIFTEPTCRDFGEPGCLQTPDPKYTREAPKEVTDKLGEVGTIYLCSVCGKERERLFRRFLAACREHGLDPVKEAWRMLEEDMKHSS